MSEKHLDAKGEGEQIYDYDNDVLLFKVKEREYLKSLDFDNFIIDIDTEGFIIGMRVFDASKIFNIDKYGLKNIKGFEFKSKIEDKVINLQLKFTYELRNKQIAIQGENFTREALNSKINDSEVLCTVA
jgi:uncharacterized protein YuzE